MNAAPNRFIPAACALHWLMAALIVAMLFIGIGLVASVSARHEWLLAIHKPLGIAILLLAVIRLAVRLRHPPLPLTETADLASIDIVGRDGPRPLRIGSGVRSVGCLAKDAGDVWRLVRAAGPVRTRNPMASSERDLARARATPLGTSTITLTGATAGHESGIGMKVEVKGALAGVDPSNYRVTVMSLQAIAPACA